VLPWNTVKHVRRPVASIVALLLLAPLVHAQSGSPARPRGPGGRPVDRAEAARAVEQAAREVRESLQKVLALDQQEARTAATELEAWRAAHAAGQAHQEEVEEAERALGDAESRAAETLRMLLTTEHLLAEAAVADQLARLERLRPGGYAASASLIRYNGPRPWSPADVPSVERFFTTAFARPLPVSALGQTAVHSRLGLDHRDAVDVAVHPNSAEGAALMAHLRAAGIPFIAFREAVPGAATGAHIHIGKPSTRARTVMPVRRPSP
jgi:hypothetical protein